MTGRDLILYILANNLENEPVFADGRFIGFVTAGEAAAKLHVGIATILAWIQTGRIKESVIFNDTVYIPANFELVEDSNE